MKTTVVGVRVNSQWLTLIDRFATEWQVSRSEAACRMLKAGARQAVADRQAVSN